MNPPWKPEGYPDVSPYLIVDGAQRLLDFLRDALGGEVTRRYDAAEGGILHSELRIGDSTVMIADSAPGWPAQPAHLHVYVPDVDRIFDQALAAGGEAVQAPALRDGDPDRRGGFRDPAGNTWWVATQRREDS